MIGRLNHIAIAVPRLAEAVEKYRDVLGAEVSAPLALPEQGVTAVFVSLPNTKIELLEPLGEKSLILNFLKRNPDGGVHHLCFEVDDVLKAKIQLQNKGVRILGSGEPRNGVHNKPVLFLHPKDFCATLIEIEEC